MRASGLFKSNRFKWSAIWCGLVGFIILLDVFIFVPEKIEIQTLTDPGAEGEGNEPIELTWLGPPDFAIGSEEMWVENYLESLFNLELHPLLLDPNAYQRKKPLMLAGGPVPDVIWEADPLSLKMAVEHKFITEVPYALISKYMPEYFKDLTREAPTSWLYSSVNGHNYGIPTYNRFGGQPSRPGIWRMDWLRNVGIDEIPSTLEEYHEALYRFRNEDPDGNGLDDTYGMSGDISNWWWTSFTEIFGAFGVTPFDWQKTGEGIVWGGIRDETRDVLELLQGWYEEGLIHPDFVVDNAAPGQSLDQKFYSGKIGYLNYKGTFMDSASTLTGSFSNNFLNLRLPKILRTNVFYTNSFLGCIENALLEQAATMQVEYLLSDERNVLLDEVFRISRKLFPQQGDQLVENQTDISEASDLINKTIKNWILEETVYGRFDETDTAGTSFEYTPSNDEKNSFKEELYVALKTYVHEEISKNFAPAKLKDFRDRWQQHLSDLDPMDAAGKILEGDWDDEARESIGPFLVTTGAQDSRAEWDLFAVVKQYYFRQLDEGSVPPILVPGKFPVGPSGQKGARAWGKPGNIVAFGRQVAEQPEKAIAVMKMLEALHTDIKLYWESKVGREGLHWEWKDPVGKASSGKGFTMKSDYVDPESGKESDLQVIKNAKRKMLHPSLGFYNLVAGKVEFAAYEDQRKFHYETQFMNEKWGLTNPLGKSDVVPSASSFLGDLRMRQQTFFAEVIRGTRSISEFADFKRLWMEKGGTVLLKEANELYDGLGKIQSELEKEQDN